MAYEKVNWSPDELMSAVKCGQMIDNANAIRDEQCLIRQVIGAGRRSTGSAGWNVYPQTDFANKFYVNAGLIDGTMYECLAETRDGATGWQEMWIKNQTIHASVPASGLIHVQFIAHWYDDGSAHEAAWVADAVHSPALCYGYDSFYWRREGEDVLCSLYCKWRNTLSAIETIEIETASVFFHRENI